MDEQPRKVFLSYPNQCNKEVHAVLREVLDELSQAHVIDWQEFDKGEFIGPKIFDSIREASLVVTVLTDDAHNINDNVLIEFGAAFAMQRPVVPLAEARATTLLPFNLRDIALLTYEDRELVTEQGRAEFRTRVLTALHGHIERLLAAETSATPQPESPHRRELLTAQGDIEAAYASLRSTPGMGSQISAACARIRQLSREKSADIALASAWELVRRLQAVARIHDDAGVLLWRAIAGFVCLMPVLWLVLMQLPRLVDRPDRIAAMPAEQVFTGLVYALGPLLLAVPVARWLARAPASFGLLGYVAMPLFAVWGTANFLMIRDGWISVSDWQANLDTQQILARGAVLGFVFSAVVTLSMRRAALTLNVALKNCLRAVAVAVVVFSLLRLAVVYLVEPYWFGAEMPAPDTFLNDTLFGLVILLAFVLAVVLAIQTPWVGYRRVTQAAPNSA